ncbi:MAG: HAD-IA family hydrolase [Proteobacteria bacterium]|nr:HAD-IA family hydrolase [Pseudomonadota bacterium]
MPLLTPIFDFDGTVADTMSAYARAWNQVAPSYGLRSITTGEVNRLRHENPGRVMKYLGLSRWRLPSVVRRLHRELHEHIDRLDCFPGIREALAELKSRGHILGIVSSNDRANLDKFLRARDLERFDFIYTAGRVFGKHSVLKSVLKKHGLGPDRAIYVCDEVRDVQAAHRAGLRVLAVSWGFNSRQALEKENPEALAESPGDLAPLIEQLSKA